MSYEVALPLFFAVPIPAEVQALGVLVQDQLRNAAGSPRFPQPEGLHVTLAFLGPLTTTMTPTLLGIAREAVRKVPEFALVTAGVGGFPRPDRVRTLWLGFEPQPLLDTLAERLRSGLAEGRVPFDAKPFRPHLTLARFREPLDLDRAGLAGPPPTAFRVPELVLFQSVQTGQGTRYTRLGAVQLALP